MFRVEKWLSVLWLGCCYSLFSAALILVDQVTPPQPQTPTPRFTRSSVDASAKWVDDSIPKWEIVSVPVSLGTVTRDAFRCECIVDSDLPSGVEFLNSEAPLETTPGQDSARVRLKVNWRLIRDLVSIPLRLSSDSPPADPASAQCVVRLIPLPRIAAAVQSSEVREGVDQQIVVELSIPHAFPAPVSVRIALTSGSKLQTSFPDRIIDTIIPANTSSTLVQIPVADNDIASGDWPVSLKVSSAAKRAFVNTPSMRVKYVDDEQLYQVAFDKIEGVIQIDENNPADLRRSITLGLDKPCGTKGLVVPINVGGSAEALVDYRLSATQFVFEPGQTQSTVQMLVKNDSICETTETILISLLRSKEVVFDSQPRLGFKIIDHDPMLVTASIDPSPCRLEEGEAGSHGTLRFRVAEDQSGASELTPAQRTVTLAMRSLEGNPSLDSTIEFFTAEGKSLVDNRLLLPDHGNVDVMIRVKEDQEFRGRQTEMIAMTASDNVMIDGTTTPVVIAIDNDPFPASLRIQGTIDQDEGREAMPALDEADVSRTAKLFIELDLPAARSLMFDLKIFGAVDFRDLRLGPSEFLLPETADRIGEQTFMIPVGTRTIEIPISVTDDEDFEGFQVASFDLVPSVGNKDAKLRILDDDPVLVGSQTNPIIVQEGQKAKFRIGFLNASSGIEAEVPFELKPGESENGTQYRFDTLNGIIPEKMSKTQQFVEIEVAAIPDNQTEGRTKFKIDLALPSHGAYYRPIPLDLWIDDAEFDSTGVVVLVVNDAIVASWNLIRGPLTHVINDNKERLAGKQIILVGGASSVVPWDGSSVVLPVPVIAKQPLDVVLDRVVNAINTQLKNQDGISEALVIWDDPGLAMRSMDPKKLSTALPDAGRLKLSTIFYGVQKSDKGFDVLESAATQKIRGTRKHRFGFQSDTKLIPDHLSSYLKSLYR